MRRRALSGHIISLLAPCLSVRYSSGCVGRHISWLTLASTVISEHASLPHVRRSGCDFGSDIYKSRLTAQQSTSWAISTLVDWQAALGPFSGCSWPRSDCWIASSSALKPRVFSCARSAQLSALNGEACASQEERSHFQTCTCARLLAQMRAAVKCQEPSPAEGQASHRKVAELVSERAACSETHMCMRRSSELVEAPVNLVDLSAKRQLPGRLPLAGLQELDLPLRCQG
jgi:hypothetical protein